MGYVITVEEYIENRLHLSGMLHTVALTEYAENSYLNLPKLVSSGLADDARTVDHSCAALGAFVNDLFSFEKEFIDEGADNNLISVTILNQPRKTLAEVIHQVVPLLRRYLAQYFTATTRPCSDTATGASREPSDSVASFLNSMQAVVQATWKWQSNTQRCKRKKSIFREDIGSNTGPSLSATILEPPLLPLSKT
ncbi:MAG TPA: terpene synthase family protein [Pseudonocardiaceae bacterium]|nr:terpene synthase family protein [Pseudonocardiaceae bacterium]